MAQCMRLTRSLGQETSVQTMDQQLYSMAEEIKWHLKDQFSTHFLRLGSLHTMMLYISSIGKIWGDAGLRDLLVISEVYVLGTAELFLQGKEYNRAITALIYIYEALSQARFTEYLKYIKEKKSNFPRNCGINYLLLKTCFFKHVNHIILH